MSINARYILCGITAGSLGVMSATAATQQTLDVKIGFAAPLTGAQAHYGADFRNGVTLAIQDMNATHPVIGGKQITFVIDAADDQADPRIGTLVAQKLVDDGVVAVLGHFNSGVSIPAAPIYARAGIPEVAMASAPAYTQLGLPTTFRLVTSDAQQAAVLGRYAVNDLHLKRIAVIDDRTAYGQGIADEFSAAAKAAGAKIVDQQYTNDQAVDFRSILTHTKALHADAIFYGGADTQAGAMIKQMHTLAMSMPLIGADMIHSDELIQIAGGAAEGTLASSGGSPLDKMPGGASYVARYTKRFNSPVELFSPYAYDGAMAVFAAMKKADSVDPHLYLADLKATRMQGVTSNDLGYDSDGDLRHGSVTVYKVKDGKWISAKTVVTK